MFLQSNLFVVSLNRNSKFYFYSTFIAYFLGLVATIFVMHMFKHAQPALLYLVPACLGTPLSLALIKGDIAAMFQWVYALNLSIRSLHLLIMISNLSWWLRAAKYVKGVFQRWLYEKPTHIRSLLLF